MESNDDLLKARILDAALRCETRWQPQFLGFLDERQKLLAGRAASGHGKFLFWGGYPQAERTYLGFFPGETEPAEEERDAFPLTAVECSFSKTEELSHRDVLGAVMALGVKRETIGDILTEAGRAVLFVQRSTAPYLLENLSKIGRTGVTCKEVQAPVLPKPRGMQAIEGTAASLRIDCVLGIALKQSRSKCAALISGGAVTLRFEECRKQDAAVALGDVLSVRGYGKYRLAAVGGQSKKGRIHITMERYM